MGGLLAKKPTQDTPTFKLTLITNLNIIKVLLTVLSIDENIQMYSICNTVQSIILIFIVGHKSSVKIQTAHLSQLIPYLDVHTYVCVWEGWVGGWVGGGGSEMPTETRATA